MLDTAEEEPAIRKSAKRQYKLKAVRADWHSVGSSTGSIRRVCSCVLCVCFTSEEVTDRIFMVVAPLVNHRSKIGYGVPGIFGVILVCGYRLEQRSLKAL
jgi:hypothetical protein